MEVHGHQQLDLLIELLTAGPHTVYENTALLHSTQFNSYIKPQRMFMESTIKICTRKQTQNIPL